jgi:hypothetical protein
MTEFASAAAFMAGALREGYCRKVRLWNASQHVGVVSNFRELCAPESYVESLNTAVVADFFR